MFPINQNTPDPPEAPAGSSTVSLDRLAELPLSRLLDLGRSMGSYVVTNDGAREAFTALHRLDAGAAVRLLSDDITTASAAADEAQTEMYGDFSGPLDPVAVETMAQGEGISLADAAAVVSCDREIAQARHELAAPISDVPWLDGRTLSSSPRPWSAEDFERDRRRAQAAELHELDRSRWQMSAEQGGDAVSELIEERMLSAVSELERKKVDTLIAARERAARPAQEAQARAKAAAQKQADAQHPFELYSGEPATMPDGTPARW